MMTACCVPMMVIAIVLVAAGAVSASWLIAALMCTAMTALMMRGMHNS
jgi:multidrug efflux pump subunit AcrB